MVLYKIPFCSDSLQIEMNSRFLLCLLSPVIRAKLCDGGDEQVRVPVAIDADDITVFSKMLSLGMGVRVTLPGGVEELLALGKAASRYGVKAVADQAEDTALRLLSIDNCGLVLNKLAAAGNKHGMPRLERAARDLALSEFVAFSSTESFTSIAEEVLAALLEDDELTSTSGEETVFQAVVRWIRSAGGGREDSDGSGAAAGREGVAPRGEALLRRVRFPLMDQLYLANEAREALPDSNLLEDLVLEAGMVRGIPRDRWSGVRLRYLARSVLAPRRPHGEVHWEGYALAAAPAVAAPAPALPVEARHGEARPVPVEAKTNELVGGGAVQLPPEPEAPSEAAGRALPGPRRVDVGQRVSAVLPHSGLVLAGLYDGGISMWDRATLQSAGATLHGHTSFVRSLVALGRWVVSGSADGTVRVWDTAAGRCEAHLEGHTDWVYALAVMQNESGSPARLVSASGDKTLRIWLAQGAPDRWRWERTLAGHEGDVICVAALGGGRVASGSEDRTIRVWVGAADAGSGEAAAVLRGHSGAVFALAATAGRARLYSASEDRTVRAWSTDTWECLITVEAFDAGANHFVWSLAMCGTRLVGGSSGRESGNEVASFSLSILGFLSDLCSGGIETEW